MNRNHLNAGLAVVVVGLVAAVWFARENKEVGPPLTALKIDAVDDVRIEHPNAAPIHLHKAGGKWQLLEPVKADVDAVEMNGILSLAEMETRLSLDPAQVKTADLKLDPPQYTVTLNGVKLGMGDVEPLNYRRYVATGGKIVLVDDPPSPALDADYSDLVDKALIPAGAKIAKVELPKLTVALAEGGKSWTLTPDDPQASADQRQKFIDAWTGARALWMAAEPAEGSAGDPVTVTLQDGRVLNFVVATLHPQLILARPDLKVRYTLSKALEEEMLKIPSLTPPAAAPEVPAATDVPLPSDS